MISDLEPIILRDKLNDYPEKYKYGVYNNMNGRAFKRYQSLQNPGDAFTISAKVGKQNMVNPQTSFIKVDVLGDFRHSAGVTGAVIQAGEDSFASYPIERVMSNFSVGFDGMTFEATQPRQWIDPLTRFNYSYSDLGYDNEYSYKDQAYKHSLLSGTARNPMNSYTSSNNDFFQRGSVHDFTISQAGTTGATFSASLYCKIPSAPYFDNSKGLVGFTNYDFNFQFADYMNMWSRNNNHTNGALDSSSSIRIYQVEVWLDISNANRFVPQNPPIYRYHRIRSLGSQNVTIAANDTGSVTFNSAPLIQYPESILTYARLKDTSYFTDPTKTDSYANISYVKIGTDANSNQLADCPEYSLSLISKENGLRLNYNQWHGSKDITGAVKGANVGSLLWLKIGKDIQIPEGTCAGMKTTDSISMDITLNNISDDSTDYTVFMYAIEEGIFYFNPVTNNWLYTTAPIDVEAIKYAYSKSDYKVYQSHGVENFILNSGGGNFIDDLISGVKTAYGVYKQNILPNLEDVSDTASRTMGAINPLFKIGQTLAPHLLKMAGAGMKGGKEMDRQQMFRRLGGGIGGMPKYDERCFIYSNEKEYVQKVEEITKILTDLMAEDPKLCEELIRQLNC